MPYQSSLAQYPLKCALTIATSDSGGGAGIEADLKTFAANQVFGLCVLSAVTAQNSRAVTALECLSPAMVTAQLEALDDDFKVSAIKIGLLGNKANTQAVCDFLTAKWPQIPLILDPVMVSTSGHTFLPPDAVEALKRLMALSTLITPNIPEAEVLSGLSIKSEKDTIEAGRLILKSGVKNVLIKGGHGEGPQADDLLIGADETVWFRGERVNTPNSHGTGCTLSSAICANVAKGLDLSKAVKLAKEYVAGGLKHSVVPGKGPGCLNHFHQYYLLKTEV